MFTKTRQFFKSAVRGSKQNFSTDRNEEPKSGFGRVVAFVSENKQPLVNIFAVYLVVSFGVHNFKVQKAWEKHQIESKKVKLENETLKSALLNKDWIESVESKVRVSKPAQDVLLSELEGKINSVIAELLTTEDNKNNTATAVSTDPLSKAIESELSSVGSEPVGVKVSSSDSGRVI